MKIERPMMAAVCFALAACSSYGDDDSWKIASGEGNAPKENGDGVLVPGDATPPGAPQAPPSAPSAPNTPSSPQAPPPPPNANNAPNPALALPLGCDGHMEREPNNQNPDA